MDLSSIILEDLNDLYRIYNSQKDYIVIDTLTTNAGSVQRVHLTNIYKAPSNDGTVVCYTLTEDYKDMILAKIKIKMDKLSKDWTKFCYDMTFDVFLSRYELSKSKYRKLRRLVCK